MTRAATTRGPAKSYVKGRRVGHKSAPSHISLLEKFSHVFAQRAEAEHNSRCSPDKGYFPMSRKKRSSIHRPGATAVSCHDRAKSSATFGQSPLKDGPTPRLPIPCMASQAGASKMLLHRQQSAMPVMMQQTSSDQSGSKGLLSNVSKRTMSSPVLTPTMTTASYSHQHQTSSQFTPKGRSVIERSLSPSKTIHQSVAHLIRPIPSSGCEKITQSMPVSVTTITAKTFSSSSSQKDEPLRLPMPADSTLHIQQPPSPSMTKSGHLPVAVRGPALGLSLSKSISLEPQPAILALTASPLAAACHSTSRPVSGPTTSRQATSRQVTHNVPVKFVSKGAMVTIPQCPHSKSMPASLNAPSLPQLHDDQPSSPTLATAMNHWIRPASNAINKTSTSRTRADHCILQVQQSPTVLLPSRQFSPNSPKQVPSRILYSAVTNSYEPVEQAISIPHHHITSPVDVIYEGRKSAGIDLPSSLKETLVLANDNGALENDEVSLRDLILKFHPPVGRGEYEGLPNIPKVVGKNKKPMRIPKNLELDSVSGYIVPSEGKYTVKHRRNNLFCVHC